MRKDNDIFNLYRNWTYRGPSNYSILLGFGILLLVQHKQGVEIMTYTVATRPVGSTSQFTPVSGFILMTLRQAQELSQEYRAAGYDAVAFNTQVGV